MSGLTFIDYTFRLHNRGGAEVSYQACRQDASGNPQYFAWFAEDGSYVIMEQDRTDLNNVTMTYYWNKDSTTLAANWIGRAALTYVEYHELFSD